MINIYGYPRTVQVTYEELGDIKNGRCTGRGRKNGAHYNSGPVWGCEEEVDETKE